MYIIQYGWDEEDTDMSWYFTEPITEYAFKKYYHKSYLDENDIVAVWKIKEKSRNLDRGDSNNFIDNKGSGKCIL
jgi:hypothetical protein